MSMQQRLQDLITQLKSMEIYLNELITREATIMRLLEEANLTINALNALDSKEAIDVMTPIGMSVYVKTTINPSVKFLVNIGAGVFIEKSREETLTFIENRRRELETALSSILSQKREVEQKMEEMRKEANDLIISIQRQQR